MIKKAKDPKAVPELGVGKDGYKTGGVTIQATDPFETQTVTVRGTKAMRADKKPVQAKWYQVMWLSAIKLAVSAGSKIYANKQKAKVAMSDAQLLHAERQARGEEAYQGKLLEARQTDYKDEAVLVILTLPILVLAYGVFSDDAQAMDKIKVFFDHCIMN